jgi:hypothetical protein
MKRIVLAVALLLVALTATNAAPPRQSIGAAPARQDRQKGVKSVKPTKQRAPAQAPTQAARKALPATAKAPGQTQVATKGQAAQQGRLPNKAAAPLRLDSVPQDVPDAIFIDPTGDGVNVTPGQAAGIGVGVGAALALPLLFLL